MKIRIYLDLLQYTPMEKKMADQAQKRFGSSKVLVRDLDLEKQWHVDVLISKNNSFEIQVSQGFHQNTAQTKEQWSQSANAARVGDIVQLLEANPMVSENAMKINFEVIAHNNRLQMGRMGFNYSEQPSQAKKKNPAPQSSLVAKMSTSFFKDDTQYRLYCINIRGRCLNREPSLSIRKLDNQENLFQIEQQNRNHEDLVWTRAELTKQQPNLSNQQRLLYLNLFFQDSPLPEYKYVYCSQNMIALI